MVINYVKYFLEYGYNDLVYKIVGEYVFVNVRGVVIVGLVVEKCFKL